MTRSSKKCGGCKTRLRRVNGKWRHEDAKASASCSFRQGGFPAGSEQGISQAFRAPVDAAERGRA